MDEKLFDELVESIREAGAYLRGEPVPVRVTVVSEGTDLDNMGSDSAPQQLGVDRRIAKAGTRTAPCSTSIPSPTQSVGEGGACRRAG